MRLQKSLHCSLELFLIFRAEVRAHNQPGQYDINYGCPVGTRELREITCKPFMSQCLQAGKL